MVSKRIHPLLGIFLIGAPVLLGAMALPIGADAATCSQMTANNITFRLDVAHPCGQFVTGDWWVVGPVTIQSISPDVVTNCGGGSKTCHGWEVNPDVTADAKNGFDGRALAKFVSSRIPNLPYNASPGDSVVKVRSYDLSRSSTECVQGSGANMNKTCVDDVMILTVLGSAPAADAFRPPYIQMSGSKPIHRLSEVDLSSWPNLGSPPGSAPSLSAARQMWNCPVLDHFPLPGGRNFHGRNCLRNRDGEPSDYGAEVSRTTGMTLLRSMHNDLSTNQKRDLLVPLIQYGIDLYYELEEWAPTMHWAPWGGHSSGRKLPILAAGKALNHSGMLGIGTTYGGVRQGSSCDRYFGEDGQTYYGTTGEALWGQAEDYYDGSVCGCSGSFGGNPGYDQHLDSGCNKKLFCRDPDGLVDGGHVTKGYDGGSCRAISPLSVQRDRGEWEASDYQWCCTSAPWVGTQTAALFLGLKDAWNYPAFFDYVDRWMSPPWNGVGGFGDAYFGDMYDEYQACAPDCLGEPDGSPARPQPPFQLE